MYRIIEHNKSLNLTAKSAAPIVALLFASSYLNRYFLEQHKIEK